MLRCKGLSVSYVLVEALTGVSLAVERGECVALLGANGAGKTTLLRTISGLIRPTAGSITLNEANIVGTAAETIVGSGLSHVPERRRIFPGLTILENLEVATSPWRRFNMSIDEDLNKCFELFPRLKERRQQLGWSLSGGEQQMLAIGRSLMSRPEVLLLDEPSLGLAPLLAEEVYLRLQDISRTGVTMLLVEQNTAMALDIASRGYVLEHGHVVLEGSSGVLRDNPRVREAYLGT